MLHQPETALANLLNWRVSTQPLRRRSALSALCDRPDKVALKPCRSHSALLPIDSYAAEGEVFTQESCDFAFDLSFLVHVAKVPKLFPRCG